MLQRFFPAAFNYPTIIRSSAYLIAAGFLFIKIEKIVNEPIRPANIVTISTNLEFIERELVIPVDNPTVPNAEKVSKRSLIKATLGSNIANNKIEKNTIANEKSSTTKA